MRPTVAPLLLLLPLAAPVAAQDAATAPAVLLRTGTTVRVRIAREPDPRLVPSLRTARVRGSTPDTLRLRFETQFHDVPVPARAIVRIDTMVGRPSRGRHALLGAGVLGATGLLAAGVLAAIAAETVQEAKDTVVAGTVTLGAAGATIGWILPPRRRWATVVPDRVEAR